MESIDFTKCFAYEKHLSGNNKCCSALTEDVCKSKGKCNFFKTVEQYYKDVSNAEKRNREKRLEKEYDSMYEKAKNDYICADMM